MQLAVQRIAVGGGDDSALVEGIDVLPAELVIDFGRVVARAWQLQMRRARIERGTDNTRQLFAARVNNDAVGVERLAALQAVIETVAAVPAAEVARFKAAVVKKGMG